MLDMSGILRESPYVSSRKRKSAIRADNDFYSSDEDSFLDRTGEIECKREKRIKKTRRISGSYTGEVGRYECLLNKTAVFILKSANQIRLEIDWLRWQLYSWISFLQS